MKNFINDTTVIMANESDTRGMLFSELIVECANTPLQTGMRMSDIKERVALLELFEHITADAEVPLEEVQYQTLLVCVDNMTWGVVHPDLVTFSDYIHNLK